MGGGSGALKFWKWVLAAFYQKLPTQKNAFTSHVIKCFCALGNTIIYHLKSMPNKIWNRIDDSSRFQVMRGHTEMFLVLKITKDSKLFHVRIWSKKWFGSVMAPAAASATVLLRSGPWWKLMTAYFQPSTKFLPDLPLLDGIVPKKPTYWAAAWRPWDGIITERRQVLERPNGCSSPAQLTYARNLWPNLGC